jgi:hypothetical protein
MSAREYLPDTVTPALAGEPNLSNSVADVSTRMAANAKTTLLILMQKHNPLLIA